LSADFSTVFFTEQNKVAPGEIKTPGYVTFNFQLNFVSLIYNDIQTAFSLGIENIIDKNYRNHLSTNRGFIISEPGRNIFIRANVEF
jgi:outer membrane receptor protein involved in Fe transport